MMFFRLDVTSSLAIGPGRIYPFFQVFFMDKTDDFLQSVEWRKFQESTGRRTFCIAENGFCASIIEHKLPLIGRYFYVPRGPICKSGLSSATGVSKLIDLARKEKISWIRIEPVHNGILENIKESLRQKGPKLKILKAPHDMQPREILIIDITKPESQLLSEMKPKTRYNIKVAQKHNVSVRVLTKSQQPAANSYLDEFINLVKITAKRDRIVPHPESYYRKMFEVIPEKIIKLYVAEYESKIIAANIVVHYGNTAIYLHGASSNEHRNIMAPYLLHWQAILDAKKNGLERYDLGGVSTTAANSEVLANLKVKDKWKGITRFKLGFSRFAQLVSYPGSYDIIIDDKKYFLYRLAQKMKYLKK